MNRETLARFAQIFFGLAFIAFGLNHFFSGNDMAAVVPDYLPGNKVLYVWLTGLAMLAAGLCFVIQRWMAVPGYLLGCLLLVFAFTIHLPNWLSENAALQSAGKAAFLKDVALAMAAFYMGSRTY